MQAPEGQPSGSAVLARGLRRLHGLSALARAIGAARRRNILRAGRKYSIIPLERAAKARTVGGEE